MGLAALFLVIYWMVLRPVKQQALSAFRQLPGAALTAQICASGRGRGPGGHAGAVMSEPTAPPN